MLVIIGVLLTAGQLLLAFTSALPAAVPARILVGMGDAIVFSAVLALIPRWFPPRRVPLIAQGSTILGRLGQILSAVPFALLLHGAGRSVAFGTVAAGSALVAVLVLAVVRNGPGQPAPAVSARQIAGQVRAVWKRPGTRLGFFGHMGTQFSMMVFALLWGVPYLVSGQQLSASTGGGW
jgi:predicted MFS family arabinose efflux permease